MNDTNFDASASHLKFVMLGDHGVGKSALAQRFAMDGFPVQYKETVGMDMYRNTVFLPGDVHVEIEVWDVGGTGLHSRMTKNYVYGANVLFLVYDVTNYASFQLIEEWIKALEIETGFQLPTMVLLGNKVDLGHQRTVKPEEHAKFAQLHSLVPYLVSAKTKDGLMPAFTQMAGHCLGMDLKKADIDAPNTVLKAMVIQPSAGAEQRRKQVTTPPLTDDDNKCSVM